MRSTLFVLLMALLGLAGCQTSRPKEAAAIPAPQIPSGSHIYIRLPEKFRPKKEKDEFIDSGGRTAEALQSAFLKFTRIVYISKEPIPLEAALAAAASKRAQYLVSPVIENWEDHPTEWNAIRDKLKLKISLYEVASGQKIYEKELEARSKFMTDGGDQPQDLLPRLASEFVNSLFQVQYTPSALR